MLLTKMKGNKMVLLNLKTFLNNTLKKGGLYYYDHLDYHIFTNGKIAYAIGKGTRTERPDQYLDELTNAFTIKLKTSRVLDGIVEIYNTGVRNHVTKFENSYINNHKTVNVFSDLWNNRSYLAIDRNFKNCCKTKPQGSKECFFIDTNMNNKEISLYFESTPQADEFILIMPIERRKD